MKAGFKRFFGFGTTNKPVSAKVLEQNKRELADTHEAEVNVVTEKHHYKFRRMNPDHCVRSYSVRNFPGGLRNAGRYFRKGMDQRTLNMVRG